MLRVLGPLFWVSAARALTITGDGEPSASDSSLELNLLLMAALAVLIFPSLGVVLLAAAVQFLVWWSVYGDGLNEFAREAIRADPAYLPFVKAWAVQLAAAIILPYLAGALLRFGWTRSRAAALGAALALAGLAAAGGRGLDRRAFGAGAAGLLAAAAVSAFLARGSRPGPARPVVPVEAFARHEDGVITCAPAGILGRRFIVPPERRAELEARLNAGRSWGTVIVIAVHALWIFCAVTLHAVPAVVVCLSAFAVSNYVCRWSISRSVLATAGLEERPWPGQPAGDFFRWATLSCGAPLAVFAWGYGLSGLLGPARESLEREGLSLLGLAREIGAARGVAGNLRRLAIGVLALWPMFGGWLMIWAYGIMPTVVCLVALMPAFFFPLGIIVESAVGLNACRRA